MPARETRRPALRTFRAHRAFAQALLVLALLSGQGRAAAEDVHFAYLFPRSTYVDNLLSPGHWWANPALLAAIRHTSFLTANAAPLGDEYLISSARLFWPALPWMTIGASVLGAGRYQPGSSSSSATESSLRYQSDFDFSRPRLQLGVAARTKKAGSAGILLTGGANLERTGPEATRLRATYGFAGGWLSPRILGAVRFSIAAMGMYHPIFRTQWEWGLKAGFRATALESLFAISAEYTIAPGAGWGAFDPCSRAYEVFKTLASFSIAPHIFILGGLSYDAEGARYRNRLLVHAGASAKHIASWPFSGGYEIGVQPSRRLLTVHRIWVMIDFDAVVRGRHR